MTARRAEVLGELEREVGVMVRRIRRVIADRARAGPDHRGRCRNGEEHDFPQRHGSDA